MNKADRHLKKMLKYKKRLKIYGLNNLTGNFFSFRSHGKPCSCIFCSRPKNINGDKKREYKELQFQLSV